MDTITIVLFLLLAVALSGVAARMLPNAIPLPLVQITLGAAIGLLSPLRVALDPEIFFLLFLPPLLFLDGWRIPKEDLFKDRATVLQLALGLVVLTVVGIGLLIHEAIPTIPLPVAFAIGAVLSPTDPIAVSSVSARVPIPKRIMHILEGESLLNDASALVCLRFAIVAAMTGTFSLMNAATTFLWVALAGIAVGVGVTWSIAWVQDRVAAQFGADTGSEILTSLLTPFAAYLLAEHIGASGILAAVVAGITMTFTESLARTLAATRVRRTVVWDMVQFAVNGVIFVLLGEQIPGIVRAASITVRLTGHQNPWWLAMYVIAIAAALVLLRFLWAWTSLHLTLQRAHRRGSTSAKPNWRLIAVVSVAGVRGAVTLASVLTLPLVLANGTPFPARGAAIFIATGVILLSLVAASVSLPLLLTGVEVPADPPHEAQDRRARIAAAQAAIAAVQRAEREMAGKHGDADMYRTVGDGLVDVYEARIARQSATGEAVEGARRSSAIERELRLAALKAEREQVFKMLRAREVSGETSRKMIRDIDLLETRFRT